MPSSLPAPWLAIECSGLSGSVCLQRGSRFWVATLSKQSSTAKSIAPAISELFKLSNTSVVDLRSLVCTNGPGSFTGLRIGLGLTRAIAFANKTPVFGISTLATLAAAFQLNNSAVDFSSQDLTLITTLNAFRDELFVASWLIRTDGTVTRLTADQRVAKKELMQWITNSSLMTTNKVYLASPEPPEFFAKSQLSDQAEVMCLEPSAMAVLMATQFESVSSGLAGTLPVYMRGSAAEEKRQVSSSSDSKSTSFPTA